MTVPWWPWKTLRGSLRRQLAILRKLADKVSLTDEPLSEAAGVLRKLLSEVIELMQKQLPRTPEEHLQHVAAIVAQLGQHLRYLEKSRIQNGPWSLMPALEMFSRARVLQNAWFVFRPKWAFNYEIVGDLVGFYEKSLEGFVWIPAEDLSSLVASFNGKKIHAVSFPRVERLNALLHVNFGHELGHLIAGEWTRSQFQSWWAGVEPKVRSQLQRKIPSVPQQDLFRAAAEQGIVEQGVKEARRIANQSIKELISDAVGVHLFGPAALLAASEVAARMDLDTTPLFTNGYPPWRYRLRRMVEQLDKDLRNLEDNYSGWADAFVALLGDVRREVEQRTDIRVLESDPRTKLFYHQLDIDWQSIRTTALGSLPDLGKEPYLLDSRGEVVQELHHRLENYIPPNETGPWNKARQADIRDILSAGWISAAAIFRETDENLQDEKFARIVRLVLKAVEASQWMTDVQNSTSDIR